MATAAVWVRTDVSNLSNVANSGNAVASDRRMSTTRGQAHSKMGCSMSGDADKDAAVSGQVPAPTVHTAPAIRREGAIAIGTTAIGALALGALAVGALAIGRLAVGQLALGQAKVRRGQVGDLHISRLTIAELRIERVRQS